MSSTEDEYCLISSVVALLPNDGDVEGKVVIPTMIECCFCELTTVSVESDGRILRISMMFEGEEEGKVA